MGKISVFKAGLKVETSTQSFRVSDTEYDLYMRMDTNTNGHRQWFYFSVRNQMKTTVKFNIYRFKKKYSLFQRGMKPYVRSRKGKNYWFPGGNKVAYKKQKLSNEYGVFKDKNTYYLTFQYKFENQDDQVFFAAGIPYTYTYLNKQIDLYSSIIHKKPLIHFNKSTICKSMCGLNIPLLSIQPLQTQENQKKNFIIINTRTHAGQTSCSWVLDGILQRIASSEEVWSWVNKNNIFLKIIPMLNPDGVFMGNYRTGIIGDDFNRKFLSGKKQFFPQIYALKRLVAECKKIGNVQLFLDLHGHSILKNSFIYGPIEDLYRSYPLKSLPFNLWNASKYFKFSSCKFKFEKELHETARVYFQIKEDLLSFTCENSLGLYYDQKQTYQMCEKDYKLFGSSIIESFVELLTLQKIQVAKLNEAMKPQKVTLQPCYTANQQIQVKKTLKHEELHKSERNSSSPGKKFPSIEKGEKKFIKERIDKNNEQKDEKMSKTKRIDSKITKRDDKKIKNYCKKTPFKTPNGEYLKEQALERVNKGFFHEDLLKRTLLDTGGLFPKKIQEFQLKNGYQKNSKFQVRRKSDAIKFLPQNLKKKVGTRIPMKKISSSKYISESEQNCSLERSSTFDSAYLSNYIDKESQNNENQRKKEEESDSQKNQLSIINENFSEDYESINDEDSDSDDLCEKEKNYIFQYIRNNRKLKTTQNQEEQSSSEEEEQIKDNPQNQTNINGFRQIRFKSIEQKMEKGIPSLKPKREPHKFRQFTHKSLGREWRDEDGLIQIIQQKKLNERVQMKKRDPYFLIQIKNKHI